MAARVDAVTHTLIITCHISTKTLYIAQYVTIYVKQGCFWTDATTETYNDLIVEDTDWNSFSHFWDKTESEVNPLRDDVSCGQHFCSYYI